MTETDQNKSHSHECSLLQCSYPESQKGWHKHIFMYFNNFINIVSINIHILLKIKNYEK